MPRRWWVWSVPVLFLAILAFVLWFWHDSQEHDTLSGFDALYGRPTMTERAILWLRRLVGN